MLIDSREGYVSVYSKLSAPHKVLFECLTVMNDESMHMDWLERWYKSLCAGTDALSRTMPAFDIRGVLCF